MKRMRILTIAAAIVLLAPMQLMAQGGGQGRGMGGGGMGGGMGGMRAMLEQGSVEFLVTKAADLKLTDEQATTLKAIGEQWAAATKDDRAKIRAEMPQPGQGMGGGGGDRQAMMQRFQALQPVMEKVRDADQKAVAEAMKVLQEEQQAAARKMLEERSQPRRPGS